MEDWILYALIASITSGLSAFLFKIIAKNNYDSKKFLFYSYIYASIFSVIFFYNKIYNLSIILIILAFSNTLLYYSASILKIKWLKYIDTVIYFPLYKVLTPFIIFISSFFIFWEFLSLKEFLWIMIWTFASLLLINKEEKKRQNNLNKWLILLILVVVLNVINVLLNKYINILNFNIELFIIIVMFFWILTSLIHIWKNNKKDKVIKFNKKNIHLLSLFNGMFFISSMYFFMYALVWNTTVVYTLRTFSIIIVMWLSIVLFKEHLDKKKIFVIILILVSWLLLI